MEEYTRMRGHLCGIKTSWTMATAEADAVADIAAHIDPAGLSHMLAFFSPDYDVGALNAALA